MRPELTRPELTRPIRRAMIGAEQQTFEVEATRDECVAVAARLKVPAVASLRCAFRLIDADDVSVLFLGRLRSSLTRVCVVSAEDFETVVDAAFEVRFVIAGHEKLEFDPDDVDEIAYDGTTIDLGEAAVEQLALMLDPYPRMDGAEMPSLEEESDASPFSVLARRPAT
jgi:Large ribosomal RNA subunit accumulation protein YceD